MKTQSNSAFSLPRLVLTLLFLCTGLIIAVVAFVSTPLSAQGPGEIQQTTGPKSGHSYKNDVSPPLRDIPPAVIVGGQEHEASTNPAIRSAHSDTKDTVVQNFMAPLAMPAPVLNFNGIPFPGVACNCAPPDTDGEVGETQYVQMVNEGFQVFNKSTGASVLGPVGITTLWNGFGGVCQNNGAGDPVVLYDQLANRWLISQFAGVSVPTDECIAVSTSSDATGTFNRYGFHLGTNCFDYPHLGVWPDAYYMSMNVFNSSGTLFLGPQPFAFNRAAMLAGSPATFVSPVGPLGSTVDPFLPADLDGSILPTAGAPASFVHSPVLVLIPRTTSTWTLPLRLTRPGASSPVLRRRALPSSAHRRAPASLSRESHQAVTSTQSATG